MIIQNKILIRKDRRFFDIYIDILNIIERFNFTKTQKIIYTELLYQNYLYRDMDESTRHTMILSTPNRKEIIKQLDLDMGTFNNTLSMLRSLKGSKGLLLDGHTLNNSYCIYPDETNKIILQLDKYNDSIETTK